MDAGGIADQSLRDARIRERLGVTVVAVTRSEGDTLLPPPRTRSFALAIGCSSSGFQSKSPRLSERLRPRPTDRGQFDAFVASPGSKNACYVRVNIMVEGKGFVGHVSNNRALLEGTLVQNAAERGTPRNQAQPGSALSKLARERGFTFFAVVDESNWSAIHTHTTPGQSYTSGTATVTGNYASHSGQTTYYPGQTFVMYKPRTGLVVRCFSERPQGVYVFDAAFLERSLRRKYGL